MLNQAMLIVVSPWVLNFLAGAQCSICEGAAASRMGGPRARKEAARCKVGVSSLASIASARESRRSIDGGWPVACAGY
eukprot:s5223_g2.t1